MTQPQYPPLPPPPPQPSSKPPKRRRTIPLWVFILALVGVMFASCTAGVGMGASDTSQPVAEVTSASGANSAELDRREKTLEERNEKLNQRHRELLDREEALDKREGKLDKQEEKKAEQEAANTIPGDGVFMVGEDVKPGTYRTKGSTGFGCYWARLKDTSGDFGAIITNGNAEGPTTVTIKKSDGAFETSGCHDWKRR